MNRSTTDRLKGRGHEAKGKVKEAAGRALNDPDLEAEGTAERAAGKLHGPAFRPRSERGYQPGVTWEYRNGVGNFLHYFSKSTPRNSKDHHRNSQRSRVSKRLTIKQVTIGK